MSEKTEATQASRASGEATSYLQDEYRHWEALSAAQPTTVQQFLQAQARQLADALTQNVTQARFILPDLVVLQTGGTPAPLPAEFREQLAGGLLNRLTHTDLRTVLRQRLNELEGASEPTVRVSAALIRHTTAVHMVGDLLPAGRSVTYLAAEGEEIPSLPVAAPQELESAIAAATDAITEEGTIDAGRGELLVPYVPGARRFYLPQWVALDSEGHLLVNSVSEAEAYLASMQRFMAILHTAVSLAPYLVADESYQQKRYGMLGQLINQGRALAHYETGEIIAEIKRRSLARDLVRGLSLSLPYFDDQSLEMKLLNLEVVPAGRIMFVPAFVVRASRLEQAKVAQDTRLSLSTRKYLLVQLRMLEEAFTVASAPRGPSD